MNQSPARCYFMSLPPGRAEHQPGRCLFSLTPRFTDPNRIFHLLFSLSLSLPPSHFFFPLSARLSLSSRSLLAHIYFIFHFTLLTDPHILLPFKKCQHTKIVSSSGTVTDASLLKTHASTCWKAKFPSEISPCPTQIYSLTKRIEIR